MNTREKYLLCVGDIKDNLKRSRIELGKQLQLLSTGQECQLVESKLSATNLTNASKVLVDFPELYDNSLEDFFEDFETVLKLFKEEVAVTSITVEDQTNMNKPLSKLNAIISLSEACQITKHVETKDALINEVLIQLDNASQFFKTIIQSEPTGFQVDYTKLKQFISYPAECQCFDFDDLRKKLKQLDIIQADFLKRFVEVIESQLGPCENQIGTSVSNEIIDNWLTYLLTMQTFYKENKLRSHISPNKNKNYDNILKDVPQKHYSLVWRKGSYS